MFLDTPQLAAGWFIQLALVVRRTSVVVHGVDLRRGDLAHRRVACHGVQGLGSLPGFYILLFKTELPGNGI